MGLVGEWVLVGVTELPGQPDILELENVLEDGDICVISVRAAILVSLGATSSEGLAAGGC
jgi:hypothetical protein